MDAPSFEIRTEDQTLYDRISAQITENGVFNILEKNKIPAIITTHDGTAYVKLADGTPLYAFSVSERPLRLFDHCKRDAALLARESRALEGIMLPHITLTVQPALDVEATLNKHPGRAEHGRVPLEVSIAYHGHKNAPLLFEPLTNTEASSGTLAQQYIETIKLSLRWIPDQLTAEQDFFVTLARNEYCRALYNLRKCPGPLERTPQTLLIDGRHTQRLIPRMATSIILSNTSFTRLQEFLGEYEKEVAKPRDCNTFRKMYVHQRMTAYQPKKT